MNIMLIDSIASLLNRCITITKLFLRNQLLQNDLTLSDNIYNIERILNVARTPFLNGAFQNTILHVSSAELNTIMVCGLLIFTIIYIGIYKYISLYFSNTILIIAMGCFHTIWILFLYSIFFLKSRNYRIYTSFLLCLGNIVFCTVLLLAPFMTFIPLWITANICYASIPTVICGILYFKNYTYSGFEWPPISFIIALFNIYWLQITEYFIEQFFVIRYMKIGQLSDVIYANKIADVIGPSITQPILRNMMFENNVNVSTYIFNMHKAIIFPIICLMANPRIIYMITNQYNKTIFTNTYILYLIYIYLNSLIKVLTVYLVHTHQNKMNFFASNIYIVLRILCMLVMYRYIQTYLMIISSIIACLAQLIYLLYHVKIRFDYGGILASMLCVCGLSIIIYGVSLYVSYNIVICILSVMFYYIYMYIMEYICT